MDKEEKLTAEIIWKMFAETDRLRKENYKEIKEQFAETSKQIKEISQELGGVGKGNGKFAEDFFYHSFGTTMEVNSIKYDYIERHLDRKKGELQGEYDIVLVNSKTLLLVEVKYQLKSKDVEKFYEKQIPSFKELFPEYKDYTMHAAVAGLSIDNYAQEEAIKNGILLFTQSGQELKKLSPDNMKPTVF